MAEGEPDHTGRIETLGFACQGECGLERGVDSGFCSSCWNEEVKKQANGHAPRTPLDFRIAPASLLPESFVKAVLSAKSEADVYVEPFVRAKQDAIDRLFFTKMRKHLQECDWKDVEGTMELEEIAQAYCSVAKLCGEHRQMPPSIRDSPAWTMLAISQLHWQFSRDLRWMLYCAIVRAQYGKATTRLEMVQRILVPGGQWYKPVLNEMPYGVCVDPFCDEKLNWPSALSKLLYESLLEQHFKMAHVEEITWMAFLSRYKTCAHGKTIARSQHGTASSFEGLWKTTHCCIYCGATLRVESSYVD